jgi:hypothetical protein
VVTGSSHGRHWQSAATGSSTGLLCCAAAACPPLHSGPGETNVNKTCTCWVSITSRYSCNCRSAGSSHCLQMPGHLSPVNTTCCLLKPLAPSAAEQTNWVSCQTCALSQHRLTACQGARVHCATNLLCYDWFVALCCLFRVWTHPVSSWVQMQQRQPRNLSPLRTCCHSQPQASCSPDGIEHS